MDKFHFLFISFPSHHTTAHIAAGPSRRRDHERTSERVRAASLFTAIYRPAPTATAFIHSLHSFTGAYDRAYVLSRCLSGQAAYTAFVCCTNNATCAALDTLNSVRELHLLSRHCRFSRVLLIADSHIHSFCCRQIIARTAKLRCAAFMAATLLREC